MESETTWIFKQLARFQFAAFQLDFFFKFEAATLITSVAQKTFDLFSDSQSGKEALWKIPTAGN